MTTDNGPEKDNPTMGGKDQRPHATLDLEASEVSSRGASASEDKPALGDEDAGEPPRLVSPADSPVPGSGYGAFQFVTHMAAGVLGALVALIVAYYATATGDGTTAPGAGETAALRETLQKSEQRIAALEQALADAGDRGEQTKAAEAAAAAADERQRLTEQLASLSDRLGRVEGLPAAGISPEAVKDTLDPLNAKLAEVESRMAALTKAQGELQTNSKAAALAVALYNLRRAANEGRPYAVELQSIADMSPVTLDLTPLDARRDQGIPSLEQLGSGFDKAANAALDAENQPTDESLASDLWSKAKSFIRVRRKGDVPGDSTRAILARVEHRLNAGNLNEAIAEAEQLTGPAAAALSSWLGDLKARRAADEALATMEAKLLTAFGGDDQAKRGG